MNTLYLRKKVFVNCKLNLLQADMTIAVFLLFFFVWAPTCSCSRLICPSTLIDCFKNGRCHVFRLRFGKQNATTNVFFLFLFFLFHNAVEETHSMPKNLFQSAPSVFLVVLVLKSIFKTKGSLQIFRHCATYLR